MGINTGSTIPREHVDFELTVRESSLREYLINVRSRAGEVQEVMRFPFDQRELEIKLLALENALLRSSGGRRAISSSGEQTVREFGQALFEALFVGKVRSLYYMNLREARRQDKGLRLKLLIQPPELAVLPWEFLYDPDSDEYLCLHSKTPLVRYLDSRQPVERLMVSPPLRILGMIASPSDLELLDVEHEKRLLEEATRYLQADGLVELTWLEGQTWRDLARAMRHGPWHVFHFIGHGVFNEVVGEGAIALTDEEGLVRSLEARNLARLLDDQFDLRLVFLNSCLGARGNERDASSSTAATLVRRGVPAVLANQFEISDRAAISFARDFYQAVAEGLPVDAAVTEARMALSMDGTLEWGTPVLYMRSTDGQIFEISATDVEASPVEAAQETNDWEGTDSLRRYRESVELAWADGQLNRHEVEWLDELANDRLKLSPRAVINIEREVMGDVKELILQRQEQTFGEEHREVHTGGYAADVFISYSRKDRDFVTTLHEALKGIKRESWIDWMDIPLTAEWLEEVYSGIEAADAFAFVISPDSVDSRQCIQELAHAIEHNKRLIPILYRHVAPESVPPVLAARNWINFQEGNDFSKPFQNLIESLDTDLEWVRAHTRLLTRAKEWEREERDRSYLMRGKDLETAEELLALEASKEPRLTPLQKEYILASREAERSSLGRLGNRLREAAGRLFRPVASTPGDTSSPEAAPSEPLDEAAWLPISREEALAQIRFVQGDLLDQQVDALVISTGPMLWQFGAVGRKVVERVGEHLLKTLQSHSPLALGDAYVTSTAGLLSARFLIYAPIEGDADWRTPSSVAQGAAAALTEAAGTNDVRKIALPAIGSGAAGLYPNDVAPRVLEAIVEHLQQGSPLQEVIFAFTQEESYQAYIDAYRTMVGRLPSWWSRLTRSSTRALRLAEAIRQRTGADRMQPEHLLAGLYLVPGEEAETLLTTLREDHRTQVVALIGSADITRTEVSQEARSIAEGGQVIGVDLGEIVVESVNEVDPVVLQAESMAALEAAVQIADAKDSEFVRARHVIGGLLAIPNRAAAWLGETTGQPVERLRRLIDKLPENERLTAEGIRNFLLQEDVVAYDVQLDLPPAPVTVGEEFEVTVSLRPPGTGEGTFYALEVTSDQASGDEIEVLFDTKALQIKGTDAGDLPLGGPGGGGGTLGAAWPQARFLASAVRPGPAKVEALLYLGSVFRANLEGEVQVDRIGEYETHLTLRPRPVPQPDLVLETRTQWSEDHTAMTFQHQLKSLGATTLAADGVDGSAEALPHGWVERAHGLLGDTLSGMVGGQVEDLRLRLRSLGRYLYKTVLPPELQDSLRQQGGVGRTLLILTDETATLPWELLHDGQGFLGERYIVGHWLLELDGKRPYEFPIGKASVAHYSGVDTPEVWASLLKPAGLDHLDAMELPALEPEVLAGGVLNLEQVETLRGLHVIRRGEPDVAGRLNAPVPIAGANGSQQVEDEFRRAKLSLRRNRPLVSLGYLSSGRPELTQLEDIWIPTYLSAGCSAFVGPRWAVQPAAEALFVRSFYTALWSGAVLGKAFYTAQTLVRRALPESLDWLAYTLVGDPMARAYRPVQGEGYAIVEPVGRQIEDPLHPGSEARFRVSLRRTPPVWHEERVIDVAEDLQFEHLEARIVAKGLTVAPEAGIALVRTPDRNYQGWFTLIAPPDIAEPTTLVQVYFLDGRRPVHSLIFELTHASGQDGQG